VNYRAPAGTCLCRSVLEKGGTQSERENATNHPISSMEHPSGLPLCNKVNLGQGKDKFSREIHDFIFKDKHCTCIHENKT